MVKVEQQRRSPPEGGRRGSTPGEDQFVGHLEGLKDDRGALAALRRGLGKPPGTAVEMHRYVLPWLPASMPRWEEDACYLVAALFGSYPRVRDQGSMGATLRRLVDPQAGDSIERRFMALLKCHADDLSDHLRQAVSLAKSKEVPVDYRRLLHDIKRWGHPDRYVQREWAREFWPGWSVPSEEPESETQDEEE